VGYHYYHGVYLGQLYPRNAFLFLPHALFSDLHDVLRDGLTLDPCREYSSAQYLFLAILGYVFSLVPRCPYGVCIAVVCGLHLFFGAASLRLERWCTSATHVFVIVFLSYPFLIALDRGNIESLVQVLQMAFLFSFTRERNIWSILCLGLAVVLELCPAVFLVLFLPGKESRGMLAGAAFTAATTFASLLCFRGDEWATVSFLLRGPDSRRTGCWWTSRASRATWWSEGCLCSR
jgi:hypothetical protein